MAVMGECEIFTKNVGEARNERVGLIMGGWDIFKVSLNIVGRGVLTHLLYEDAQKTHKYLVWRFIFFKASFISALMIAVNLFL